MRRRLVRGVVVGAFALAMPTVAAMAESIERGFDMDAFTRFEYQEKQRQDDGFVLEKVRDRRGNVAGKFSLGGNGREEDPFYNFGATQNIRAARESDMGAGIFNLRVSF
jgi:hypothetical protein